MVNKAGLEEAGCPKSFLEGKEAVSEGSILKGVYLVFCVGRKRYPKAMDFILWGLTKKRKKDWGLFISF